MNLLFRLLLLGLRARRRRRLSLWETARTPFRVVPTDLDLLLHMNNGKFLSIMDLGRMDLMLRSGTWRRLRRRGWYPVVVGQTIAYRRPLNPGQRFDLYTRILGFEERWTYVEQTFCVGSTVHAKAVVRARFLSQRGGAVEMSELLAVVGPLPPDLVVAEHLRQWRESSRIDPEFDVRSVADE